MGGTVNDLLAGIRLLQEDMMDAVGRIEKDAAGILKAVREINNRLRPSAPETSRQWRK